MITLDETCAICNKDFKLQVNEQDLKRFKNGEHIQRVMPYLTEDERELLISGVCGKCFDQMFVEEDEE